MTGASDKEQKSKMASMVAFCKKGADIPGNASALQSRGQERNDYLVKYIVHSMRKHKVTSTTSYKHTQDDSQVVDHHQWSQFELERKVGKAKSDLWIKSGKLSWVPDRVTGAEAEDLQDKNNKLQIYCIKSLIKYSLFKIPVILVTYLIICLLFF